MTKDEANRQQDPLLEALEPEQPDIVPAETDETFHKAVTLSAEKFGELFDKRASSHRGFSGRVPPKQSERG